MRKSTKLVKVYSKSSFQIWLHYILISHLTKTGNSSLLSLKLYRYSWKNIFHSNKKHQFCQIFRLNHTQSSLFHQLFQESKRKSGNFVNYSTSMTLFSQQFNNSQKKYLITSQKWHGKNKNLNLQIFRIGNTLCIEYFKIVKI